MQNWANLYKRGICLKLLHKARPARLVQNGCLRPKRRAAAAGDPPRRGKRLPPVRQTGRDLHLPGRAAGRVGGMSIAAARSSMTPATVGGRMCTQSSGQTATERDKIEQRKLVGVGKDVPLDNDRYLIREDKLSGFLLKPGAKHSAEFFGAGYSVGDSAAAQQ